MASEELLALAIQLERVLLDVNMHQVQRNRLLDAIKALRQLAGDQPKESS